MADALLINLRRFRLSLGLLLLFAAVGTVGYVVIEGWDWFDALFMSVITMSTVGYAETRPLTTAGRAFTIVFIILARATEAYVILMFAQVLVVEQFRVLMGQRRMERELQKLKNHTIICGWGRMGQEIARQFRKWGTPFVVVEQSEARCRQLADDGILAVHGDAADNEVLRAAGIERARGLIAVAADDPTNVFITLSARSLNPKLFIVARCAHEQDVQKMKVAGADRVISPYVTGARRIASAALRPNVADFLEEVAHEPDLEWELDEVVVHRDTPLAGKTLGECRLRETTGCTVMALRRASGGGFVSNPDPQTRLAAGDVLIVLGAPDELERLQALARGR